MSAGRFDEVTQAVAQFTWRGELSAYVIKNATTVPKGNSDFHIITERIAKGECVLVSPDFQYMAVVHGRNGQPTGHRTAVGFVPIDASNGLRIELEKAISQGMVQDAGISPKATLPPCSHIKFCVFFPRSWPHLKGPFEGGWRYRSTMEARWIDLAVRLSNHPTATQSSIEAAMSWLGVQPPDQWPSLGPMLQHGMLEIEFDIADLWDLYRSERKAGFGLSHEFIEDQLAEALVYDGRVGDAPDTRALISLAPQFLHRAVTDISNRVAAEFNLEYGGPGVGFKTERDAHVQHVCLLRDREGRHHLLRMGWQPPYSFELEGEWRVSERDPAEVKRLSLSRLTNRLRALIDAGFALEAISLANGFFELACRDMLSGLLAAHPEEQQWVLTERRFGYDRCRALIDKAARLAPRGYEIGKLQVLLGEMQKIYDQRNAYMHGLQVLSHDLTRSVDLTREAMTLLSPLTDAWETQKMIELVQAFSGGGASLLGEAAVTLVTDEVRGLMAKA